MNQRSELIVNEELIANLLRGNEITDPFTVARQQRRAQNAVMAALAAGVLTRPSQCSECAASEVERVGVTTAAGEPAIHRMEAHHDDYDKPLAVRWLCTKCHRKADKARRQREGLRPTGDIFAAFLLATGGIELPFRYDPPHDRATEGDCISRAIRFVSFAGFDARRLTPQVALHLSCGHKELVSAGWLANLATYIFCHPCMVAQWARVERRRARRVQS